MAPWFIFGNSLKHDCSIAEHIRRMALMTRSPASAPWQLFATTAAERTALARRQFFEEGVRPSGLVGEAVIQSWMRCNRAHVDTRRAVVFDAVTPSRLHATLGRNRELLAAAQLDLHSMESALAGTDCRVLLADAQGVIVHATQHDTAAQQPILRQTARVGINIAESVIGTSAPGIVAATGQACTVNGAEHYYDCLGAMQCAAAPIRDVHGHLAGVLDVTAESRRFGFDAASMVSLFATTIENRLLQAQSHDHLVLRFQASPSLFGTPLEGLAGIATDGTVAWMNTAGAGLIQPRHCDESGPGDVERLFGLDLRALLRLGRSNGPQPVRLTSGLSVWLQATWQGRDGIDFRHATPLPAARIADAGRTVQCIEVAETTASTTTMKTATTTTPADTPATPATASPPEAKTLHGHSRKLIEDTLAAHGGNIAQAARQLKVSRGMLYRRLHRWSQTDDVVPDTNTSAG